MATLMSAALVTLGQDIDDDWRSTTTSAGGAGGATLVDIALLEKVADWISDGMVIYLPLGPSGAGSAETRIASSLATSVLTPRTVFSAQVLSGVSYEIHKVFTRNQKLVALRNAASMLFPDIHTIVRNMTLLETTDYKYEFDISSLAIFQNRPHQVLLAQEIIRDIWVAATAYSVGDYVRPTSLSKFTGYTYKCTTAGTSHASTEPTWPTTQNGTVTDSGTLVWTRQDDLDYSNYPMLPLHDWDVTPDGLLFLNSSFTAGYALMIVGIKPLAFTGSGASETIALDTPFTLTLSAQAIVLLLQQRMGSAGSQNVERWQALYQFWQQELARRKATYYMKAPDGTLISGPGLTV